MANSPEPDDITAVPIDDGSVTVARWGQGPAEIVLLHDGLGSIAQWRGIPGSLAATTGRTVLAYDRPGHGASTPVPTGPWPTDWLHREADRFARLIDTVEVVADPLLVGHSDGGSIALIHAATTHEPLRGVLTLAAHSWVEDTCYRAIEGMRANAGPIVVGLARDHTAADRIFEAWSGVWVSDPFQRWDIRPLLSTIRCPTLVAQGRQDEYAPDSHAIETAAAIGQNGQHVLLDGVGHLLHHQDPDLVVGLIADFDRSLGHDRSTMSPPRGGIE
ncbi:MAG: alpha/beta hydrolase [Actinomycetota bacterium]